MEETFKPELENLKVLSRIVDSVLKNKKSEKVMRSSTVENDLEEIDSYIESGEKSFLEIKNTQLLKEHEATYWYMLGKMYNCSSKYRAKAMAALHKCVQLNPKNIIAWNELGECSWYNGQAGMAKKCFEEALKVRENKTSLRNLSVVLRKEALRCQEVKKKENIKKSISFAKRAVQIDPKDGTSWSILGNSYLSAFFTLHQNKQHALQAIAAYKQAEMSKNATENPDLFYNKGVALKYLESYEEALESFSMGRKISGDEWELPRTVYEDLLKYLDTITALQNNKGKLKIKKLLVMKEELNMKRLIGPYSAKKYNVVTVNDLKEGDNQKSVLYGKIIWSLFMNETFPFTLGLYDSNGDSIVVTIFNLVSGKGFLIDDFFAIPEPYLTSVEVHHEDKHYVFKKVRVNYPVGLVLNNRCLRSDFFGCSQFDTTDIISDE